MKTLKFYNSLKYSLLLFAVGTFLLVACESNNTYVSPQEYIDAENKLLSEYYEEIMPSGMTRLEEMTAESIDTVDHRRESGLMLFHTQASNLDSVGLFKQVGYRYKVYSIGRDDDGQVIEIVQDSNYYSPSPVVFTTYITNDAGSAQQTGVALGINEAIQHMREGSEATIILPSTIGGVSGYFSTKYELEVTYLQH